MLNMFLVVVALYLGFVIGVCSVVSFAELEPEEKEGWAFFRIP